MFQISPLEADHFVDCFALDADGLKARHAMIVTADAYPAYPCRVSLDFAAIGERVC